MERDAVPAIPEVIVEPEAFADMVLYAHHSVKRVTIMRRSRLYVAEISGFAKTRFDPRTNTIRVSDPLILEQINAPGGTEMHDEAMGAFLEFLAQPDVDPLQYLCWWHSHGLGGVYFSARDHRTIEEDLSSADYFVSIVVNVWADIAVRVDVYRPERRGAQINPVISATGQRLESLLTDTERISRIQREVAQKNTIIVPADNDDYWKGRDDE